jgi:hypothetical protein
LDRVTLEKFPIVKYEPELGKTHGGVVEEVRLCAAHLISSRTKKALLVTNVKRDGRITGNDELVLEDPNRGNAPQLKSTITTLRQVRLWASPCKTPLAEPEPRPERTACAICADDFVEGVDVRRLPCRHIFHPLCIDTWLLEWSGTCPLWYISNFSCIESPLQYVEISLTNSFLYRRSRTDLHPPPEDFMPKAPPRVAVLSNRRI